MKTKGEFFMIKDMYQRGLTITDIAKELIMGRKTVCFQSMKTAPLLQKLKDEVLRNSIYRETDN